MDESQKREAQLDAVRKLKAQGVYGIKLELEGTLNRRSSSSSSLYDRCTDCSGQGNNECADCRGLGWMVDEDGYETDDECGRCESRGSITCQTCAGQGQILKKGKVDLGNDSLALKWFLENLSKKTGGKMPKLGDGNSKSSPFPWMSYIKLYYDGSVDTEVTFTVRLDKEENIFLIPKVLEAFKEMADVCGNGLDVRGAGMHTALVFDPKCGYPSASMPYSDNQLYNFRRSARQLLPALYFLAAASGRSRGMGFRGPAIDELGQKSNAISTHHGAMEFRIFDTCYERPEAALDNIVVISNMMKYATERYTSPGVAEALGKSAIKFGNSSGQDLGRLFVSTDQIAALYAGLPKIMPSYYTIEELKKQREFNRVLGDAEEIERQLLEQAETEYAEYSERYDWKARALEAERIGIVMQHLIEKMSQQELKDMTRSKLRALALKQAKPEMDAFIKKKKAAGKYIKDRVAALSNVSSGDYILSFS